MGKRKHTIVYLSPALPVGGAEKFLVSLTAHLAERGDTAQTVISLSDRNPIAREFNPAVRILPIPRNSRFSLQPLMTLRKTIREINPDIIFCINFFSYVFYRLASLGIPNTPRVFISYHSTIHVNAKDHRLHQLFFKLVRPSDTIVTVCQNQASYTIETYGVPEQLFQTIYNGIDTDVWRPVGSPLEKQAIRQQLRLPENGLVIVQTAGFRPEKNHLGAIAALGILHRKHGIKATLLMVGDGPMRPAIEAAIRASGISEYIILAGQQSDVRPFYHAADLFTLTSESVETFSIAALEAMSCGLPAVLTDIGGAAEMIKEGINGYLCSPEPEDIAEKWAMVLKTIPDKAQISAFVREQFHISQMTEAYEQLMGIPVAITTDT